MCLSVHSHTASHDAERQQVLERLRRLNISGTVGERSDGNINDDSVAAVAEAQRAVLASSANELLQQWEQFDDGVDTVVDLLTEDLDDQTIEGIVGDVIDVASASSDSDTEDGPATAMKWRHLTAEALSALNALAGDGSKRLVFDAKTRALCMKAMAPGFAALQLFREVPEPVRRAAAKLREHVLAATVAKRKQTSVWSFFKKRDRRAAILAALEGDAGGGGGGGGGGARAGVVTIDDL